jgi:hypothetical protein
MPIAYESMMYLATTSVSCATAWQPVSAFAHTLLESLKVLAANIVDGAEHAQQAATPRRRQ